MTLWHIDSLGQKQVVATDVNSPQDALTYIMGNSKTRFTIPNGKIKIHTSSENHYSFHAGENKSLGFTLEP